MCISNGFEGFFECSNESLPTASVRGGMGRRGDGGGEEGGREGGGMKGEKRVREREGRRGRGERGGGERGGELGRRGGREWVRRGTGKERATVNRNTPQYHSNKSIGTGTGRQVEYMDEYIGSGETVQEVQG